MPWSLKKPCAARGCPNLVSGRWCEIHQQAADDRERARKAAFDQTRPSATKRGYTNPQWREIRRRILQRDPWCKACDQCPSSHVDHIKPRRQGGTDADANLQGLCAGCHSRKTAREDSGFTKRRH